MTTSNKLKVVLVKYRPDSRIPRHGTAPKISYQAKIIGCNGETKWLDYTNEIYRCPKRTADDWASLLGVEVTEIDISDGWGKGE